MPGMTCKYCGARLPRTGGDVCPCPACGAFQPVPVGDGNVLSLLDMANRLRLAGIFDESVRLYGEILRLYPDTADAHWGLLLAEHGIVYEEDPGAGVRLPVARRMPTVEIGSAPAYHAALSLLSPGAGRLCIPRLSHLFVAFPSPTGHSSQTHACESICWLDDRILEFQRTTEEFRLPHRARQSEILLALIKRNIFFRHNPLQLRGNHQDRRIP